MDAAGDRNLKGIDLQRTPLLTDLYQLNMMQAYVEGARTAPAVFEPLFRKLPARRGFLVAAGLAQAIAFLAGLRFEDPELDWLVRSGRFSRDFIDYLAGLRFTGDVHAMPEGTIFFPDEPILRVTAPLPEAQLVETRIINLLHFQTVIASKAARVAIAAPGKLLVDFGLRRAHGSEAGLLAARACYIGGFAGTATVLAEAAFGIPAFGTMAHSFIQAHDDEADAFRAFARSRPANLTLLIDTYDTEAGARKVVALAPELAAEGIEIQGVRLDSGDLLDLSRKVRAILDAGGLAGTRIFASGGLDEDALQQLIAAGAPIDGFGIGTSLTTSSDLPALDCAYKLQEYAGLARRKRSTGKATWPGRKQVFRRYDASGRMAGDLLTLEGEAGAGEPLIEPVMRGGEPPASVESLATARARAAAGLARLPEALRAIEPAGRYPVDLAGARRSGGGGGSPARRELIWVMVPPKDSGPDMVAMSEVWIPPGLPGMLAMPAGARGIVLFAHGSGSGRLSPRNNAVAGELRAARMATLLFDLLTDEEAGDRANVFDIPLLAERLLGATRWLHKTPEAGALPIGYFGASTGAAAALVAAAAPGNEIAAVVSRGGRPDLAGSALASVRAPTLLIVGGADVEVLVLNRQAQGLLRCESRLEIVLGATHLFEEPGTLDRVVDLARGWFLDHFAAHEKKHALR